MTKQPRTPKQRALPIPTRPGTLSDRIQFRWSARRRHQGLRPLRRQLFHNRLRRMSPRLALKVIDRDIERAAEEDAGRFAGLVQRLEAVMDG